MHIIVPSADSSDTCPPFSAVDGCPSCVLNTEPPRSVIALTAGYRATYLCSDCGHAWTTDWKD